MALKLIIPALLLFSVSQEAGAQSLAGQDLPKFMGREVTIIQPEREDNFPKGPASICVEVDQPNGSAIPRLPSRISRSEIILQ